MTNKNNKSKFKLGVILGAAAGALAGLFLAPKPGKELRKDARELSAKAKKAAQDYYRKLEGKDAEEAAKIVFGDVSKASVSFMKTARKELTNELGMLSEKYKTIDKKKYTSAVKNVVTAMKNDKRLDEKALKKLTSYLEKDAKKLVSRK